MSDHTPTKDHIRDQFIEAWAGDFVFGKVDAAKYFDRALDAHNARIESAAEQRGAIKALRDAAESDELIDHMYANLLANQPIAVRETSKYLHNRADRLEGDDEQV